MSWLVLNEGDLKTRLSSTEMDALRQIGVNAGDGDPIASILAIVSNQVRRYVVANPANRLGAAGTIPEQLYSEALDLAVLDVMKRCGGQMIDPGGIRKDSAIAALDSLRNIGRNSEPIEIADPPMSPDPMPTQAGIESGSETQLSL
jgi:hypothetical protein